MNKVMQDIMKMNMHSELRILVRRLALSRVAARENSIAMHMQVIRHYPISSLDRNLIA